MKKYISVFEMITRSTLYKVLAVIVIMEGIQIRLFRGTMLELIGSESGGLESIVDKSNIVWPLAVAFLLITIFLCQCGCNIGSNQGYTLRRLQISELAVFWLQALYNCLCYVLLWASQAALFVIASGMYMENAIDSTNQTVVIAFYRNAYMHSILPMEDGIGWVILAVIICSCAIASATFPLRQRRGKTDFSIIAVVAMVFLLFPKGIGSDMSFIVFYMLFFILASGVFWSVYLKQKEEKIDE